MAQTLIAANLWILLICAVHSFEIKSFHVSQRDGDVAEGTYADLSCRADSWWEFCRFNT